MMDINIFKNFIKGNRLEINKGVYVGIETFKIIFDGAKSYDDFIRIDNGEKGYKSFFDKCKEQGILN